MTVACVDSFVLLSLKEQNFHCQLKNMKQIVSNFSLFTCSAPQPVVKLIEEASLRGLKEVRFITLQNQYILNIKEGFQQNAVFGFRRQIKKRPMFMSSVMLMPHLQYVSMFMLGLIIPVCY